MHPCLCIYPIETSTVSLFLTTRERNQEQGAKVRLGRQVDSMWADQKQMSLENILVALLQKHRCVCVCMCVGV
jgi:hypothetical protein